MTAIPKANFARVGRASACERIQSRNSMGRRFSVACAELPTPHAASPHYCVTALAVALLASLIATAVFSPPFSVYLTETLAPALRPS